MARQSRNLLFMFAALLLLGCECPYQDELDRAQNRKSSTGDVFYAEKLLGTWQCYYPMIIGGVEFKQIKTYSSFCYETKCIIMLIM